MALAGALCHVQHAVTGGFTNKSLRGLVAGHLGPDHHYTTSKMSYDLRRPVLVHTALLVAVIGH
jgi:hypothetical protein